MPTAGNNLRVIVAGAQGQLGRSIRKRYTSHPAGHFYFLSREELNITDIDQMRTVMESVRPTHIINAAAYTNVDAAQSDKDNATLVNSEGARNLASLCLEYSAALIHVSTDYVYPGNGNTPLDETSPTAPVNFYGISKLQGERNIIESGCRYIILRTSWLYSEFGENFFTRTVQKISSGRPLRMVTDQTGSPTYAGELAGFIINNLSNDTLYGNLFNYACLGEVTRYEFALAIAHLTGSTNEILPAVSSDFPSPAVRPKYTALSTKKLREHNIQTQYWLDSLSECMRSYLELQRD